MFHQKYIMTFCTLVPLLFIYFCPCRCPSDFLSPPLWLHRSQCVLNGIDETLTGQRTEPLIPCMVLLLSTCQWSISRDSF